MRLALAQLEIQPSTVEANVSRAVAAIETAAGDGADLVCLPEVFTVGYFAFDSYARRAEGIEGETLSRIRTAAADNDVAVLAGSIVEDLAASRGAGVETPDGDLANTSVLFSADGDRLAVYRKHHLFGYGSAETELLTPGERLQTADVAGFTVGMTTCYDLRFPELYRTLCERGANLVLVPSAWPYPRTEHWTLLPRARAVENLCYVAACNGSGTFEGADATLCGRSTVYGPWGTPLASTDDDPALVTTDVDPERVEAVREEFPAWRDRRRDFIP
jgi:predicted amidohydrolase